MPSAPPPPHPSDSQHARTGRDNDVAHIGRPNADGLFYAACSRSYDVDICGCPICRRAAHHGDQ